MAVRRPGILRLGLLRGRDGDHPQRAHALLHPPRGDAAGAQGLQGGPGGGGEGEGSSHSGVLQREADRGEGSDRLRYVDYVLVMGESWCVVSWQCLIPDEIFLPGVRSIQ
ncbi:unnamed protein product [Darwinula stevensoni]|uniref:Uncharacterized protein n=1 Tax=Darwinula stevensoni TaxID=69355 RepID=A0A7R9AH47_9CRUS|nr:unnamed protein product [Darwinula stevensoni]CAG0904896.1 unnamed protein product [Darwinula stevensoni]